MQNVEVKSLDARPFIPVSVIQLHTQIPSLGLFDTRVGWREGCWLLDADRSLLVAGFWLLLASCWLLAGGCHWLRAAADRWLSLLLAAGCWLVLASGRRQT